MNIKGKNGIIYKPNNYGEWNCNWEEKKWKTNELGNNLEVNKKSALNKKKLSTSICTKSKKQTWNAKKKLHNTEIIPQNPNRNMTKTHQIKKWSRSQNWLFFFFFLLFLAGFL